MSGFQNQYAHEETLKYPLPYADGNPNFWKDNLEIQNPLADIEIVAWDSSATLFLTKDIGLYRIFRKAFPKSKDLKLFNTTDFDEANDYEKWLKYHV